MKAANPGSHEAKQGPTLTSVPDLAQNATELIDGGDLACGELLLLVYGRVRNEQPGTRVIIRTTDPAAPIDIPAWCHLTGHLYRGPIALEAGDRPRPPGSTDYLVEIAPASRPVDPANPWHPQPTTEELP